MPRWWPTACPCRTGSTPLDVAAKDPRVAGAAPFIETEALLSGPRNQPAMLRGVEPSLEDHKVSVLSKKMKRGAATSLTDGSYNILLGKELALWLGVDVGDTVMVMVPEFQGSPMGAMARYKRFTVSGVFEAGYNDIDRGLTVVHMADLQRVLRRDGASGVRLMLHDMNRGLRGRPRPGAEAARLLPGQRLDPRERQPLPLAEDGKDGDGHPALADHPDGCLHPLVNSQVMLVTDKQADIAILRTPGPDPGRGDAGVHGPGTLIGIIGTVLGFVGGVTLTWNLERILDGIEALFNVTLLPEDVYYITGLPTDMQTGDVVLTLMVALLMSLWPRCIRPPARGAHPAGGGAAL